MELTENTLGWLQPIFFSGSQSGTLPSGDGKGKGPATREREAQEEPQYVRLAELLEATLPPMGYELVDVETSPKGRLVRVFIDKPAGTDSHVSVEDCARVSNHLTHLFTVENIDYDRLEISSPGLDRPLRKLADYTRFAGEEAQLNLREPQDGARRWKGTLRGVTDGNVLLDTATGVKSIPFDLIDRCRLVPKIEWRKAK
jgi:ribosome maturation factor RimP